MMVVRAHKQIYTYTTYTHTERQTQNFQQCFHIQTTNHRTDVKKKKNSESVVKSQKLKKKIVWGIDAQKTTLTRKEFTAGLDIVPHDESSGSQCFHLVQHKPFHFVAVNTLTSFQCLPVTISPLNNNPQKASGINRLPSNDFGESIVQESVHCILTNE